MARTIRLQAGEELAGTRLDLALRSLVPEMSRTRLSRLIAEGMVSIDGRPVSKSSTAIARGEILEVQIPDPVPSGVVAQQIPLEVVFEDGDIAVINKRAGLVVHPAAGHADGTLVNALLHRIGDLSGIGGELRPGIVHRLDKETSGLLVVAKNDEAHQFLAKVWKSDAVQKEYLAIVYGTPKESQGTIDAPIGRDTRERRRMAVVASGRNAVTHFAVLERLRHSSLLLCRLATGRTHQIRVHLKSLGHPIVGDPLYSGPQWRGVPHRATQKALESFKRQALHAVRLGFPHPRSGESLSFEAPLPDDMQRLLDALRQA